MGTVCSMVYAGQERGKYAGDYSSSRNGEAVAGTDS